MWRSGGGPSRGHPGAPLRSQITFPSGTGRVPRNVFMHPQAVLKKQHTMPAADGRGPAGKAHPPRIPPPARTRPSDPWRGHKAGPRGPGGALVGLAEGGGEGREAGGVRLPEGREVVGRPPVVRRPLLGSGRLITPDPGGGESGRRIPTQIQRGAHPGWGGCPSLKSSLVGTLHACDGPSARGIGGGMGSVLYRGRSGWGGGGPMGRVKDRSDLYRRRVGVGRDPPPGAAGDSGTGRG